MASPEPSLTTPSCQLEAVGSVVVAVHFHGEAAQTVESIAELMDRHVTQHAEVGLLLVLHQGAVPPGDEDRALFIKQMRRPAMRGVAVVVLGRGFWAAAARSVVTFFGVATGLPVRLFTESDSACAWVCKKLDSPTSEAALVAATERLSAGMGISPL